MEIIATYIHPAGETRKRRGLYDWLITVSELFFVIFCQFFLCFFSQSTLLAMMTLHPVDSEADRHNYCFGEEMKAPPQPRCNNRHVVATAPRSAEAARTVGGPPTPSESAI